MLSSNEHFVIVKLTSGEQCFAALREEDDKYILIESPMCIRMIPSLETNREHVTAHPLCQFSDDTSFVIAKKDIVFIKNMHHVFVPHYLRILEEHERVNSFTPRAEDLSWDDEEDTPQIESTFVEGNDTIN